MDRILAMSMSLVGAGPCNIFGPGMGMGAGDAGRAKAEGNSRGAAAGGTRSAARGGKCAAERTAEKEANSGASADVTRSCPALDFDERFCFVDAVVAPY